MTDNEIIKALNRCILPRGIDCVGCAYEKHKTCVISTRLCTDNLRKDALDLIERQKAENERLRKALEVVDIMEDQHNYYLQKARVEAIKVFIAKAKAEEVNGLVWVGDLDKIAEKMVGDVTIK